MAFFTDLTLKIGVIWYGGREPTDIKPAVMINTFILSALMLAREGASVTATDIR